MICPNIGMKYRSRTEIIAMVLRSVSDGLTKTKIMYKAYLSYTQLREYLAHLEENELIQYDKKDHLYRITQKGIKFLIAFDQISQLVSFKPES